MDGSPAGSYDDSAASSFDFHHSMLDDRNRTEAFLKAILATVRPGDVVLDIGCGTGVLSLFAVTAGARTVYAIEREPIIHVAESIARANGVADRIRFLEGTSTDVDLPERADVLISETIGNIGFDEGILAWVTDALNRHLVPRPRVVPRSLTMKAALVDAPRTYGTIERWRRPLLTFDFTPLWDVAVNNMHWIELSPVALLTDPVDVFTVDLAGEPLIDLVGRCSVTTRRDGTIHGIGAWFEADLAEGVSLDNAPPAISSWQQGLLPLAHPIEAVAGEDIGLEVHIAGGGTDWRWRVGSDRGFQSSTVGRLGP